MVFNGPALSSATVTCSCHVSREDGIVLRTTVLKKQIIKRLFSILNRNLYFNLCILTRRIEIVKIKITYLPKLAQMGQ